MLLSTTSNFENKKIKSYLRLVTGEAIISSHLYEIMKKQNVAVLGGRAKDYEGILEQARDIAIKEMIDEAKDFEANAIVGVSIDHEHIDGMVIVAVSGTAVLVE